MSSHAISSFTSNVDLLQCLADEIHNRKLIFNLSLVNWIFHDVFTPALYRVIHLNDRTPRMQEFLKELLTSEYLRYTSVLSFTLQRVPNSIVQSLLKQMPLLTTFKWSPQGWLLGRNDILTKDTLETLRMHCPKVTELDISVYKEDSMNAEENPMIAEDALDAVSNLTGLALREIPGGQEWSHWQEVVVGILERSPKLETLLLCNIYRGKFFYRLCRSYRNRQLAPLRLRSLTVGSGFHYSSAHLRDDRMERGEVLRHLQMLADVSCLEELHMPYIDEPEYPVPILSRETTPSLRLFSGAVYNNELHDSLQQSTDPEFATQLSLRFDFRQPRRDRIPYPSTRKTMADFLLSSPPLGLRTMVLDLDLEVSRGNDPNRVLDLLAQTSEALQGLILRLPAPWGLTTQLEKLEVLVSKLDNLRELDVSSIRTLELANSWQLDVVRDFARRLADASKSLSYVRVNSDACCYHVSRDMDDKVARVEDLDNLERDEVELFRKYPAEYWAKWKRPIL